jgi:phage-related protein
MTSIMASYHLKATDSVRVMNQLKTAAGESKTTMEEFSGSLSTVLPVASANHISFAQVAGALASLTQHGTSADEATQELSNTIRNLAAPNMVAQKEMAQLGISAQDVAKHIGDRSDSDRGLTGTLNYLSETVLHKMGPAGTVLLSTFNASKLAAADAAKEMANLPEGAQKLAKAYAAGSISLHDWRDGLKALPAPQAALASQWATTENSAKGFQQALRNGVSGSQTYSEAIKKMTGGANGLNTTLQLTGESTRGTYERVHAIGAAARGAGADVSGWASTQGLLNVRLDMWKQSIEAAAIKLGMFLIPYALQAMDAIQGLVGWFDKHRQVAIALGIALAATVVVLLGWVAVAAAVAAGVAYAYTHFQTFRNIVNQVAATALVVFGWLQHTALPALIAAFHKAWEAIGAAIQWFIDNPLKWIKQRAAEFQAFWHAHGQELRDVANTTWMFISRLIDSVWTITLGLLKVGLAVLKQVWNVTWAALRDTVKLVWHTIQTIVTTGYHLVMDVIGVFLDILDGHWKQAWDDLKKTVSDAWNGLKALIGGWLKDAGHLLYDVGKALIKGLVNGIKDSFNSVKNTLGDLTNKLTSWKGPPEKDATLLYSAGKSIIAGLVRGIADSFSSVKSVLTNLTVFIGGALHQSGDSPLAVLIEKDNSKLKAAATHRDAVVKQLSDAQNQLKSLQDKQANLVQSTTDSAQSYGSIATVDGDGTLSASDIATQMQQRLDQISAFRQQIDNLKTQGINSTTLQDIISAGVDKGGQMATAIQAGGAAAVDQLNNIQAQINQQAVSLGKTAGDNMYAAGIQAAQGLVDGLTAQETALTKTMKWLAAQMVKALQDAITPSRDPGAGKGAHDPGAGTRAPGKGGGDVHLHVHVKGMYGDVKEAAKDVRSALLDMKRSGQMTTIGLT